MHRLSHLAAIGFLITFLQAGADPYQPGQNAPGAQDCANCHQAADPTAESAELKPCTRAPSPPAHTSVEAPDVFLLDQLSEIYVPVVFPHKLHAAMTDMAEGCNICHHRNPPGRVLPCRECHGGPSNPVNLRQPGLKGAYHRQCLGCHREWTHTTDCAVCHAKREPGVVVGLPSDPTDIMGMLHPNVEVPDIKVYHVEDLEDAPVVTFHHKEHVELFELKCVACHQQENCSRCHDVEGPEPHIRTDPHEDCNRCHQQALESDCTHCHADTQREGFNHARRTGFSLETYHLSLECRRCHVGEEGFSGLDQSCGSCHAVDWSPEEFDHARTGTALDELHEPLDCQDCHVEGVGKPGYCDTCHDDDRRSFPQGEPEALPKSQ